MLTTRYVYDGVLPLAELNGSNVTTRTITRGTDLSGSMQGAGGIGGILATNGNEYSYDGNGNVRDIISASGLNVAHYEYDPFGNKTASSGSYSSQPYQWSSKEFHAPSGMVYYLYRFYSPQLGRWINRDPIEEAGGINLYGFVGNDGVNHVDILGLVTDVDMEVLKYAIEHAMAYSFSGMPIPPLTIASRRVELNSSNPKLYGLIEKEAKNLCPCKKDYSVDFVSSVDTKHKFAIGEVGINIKGKVTTPKPSSNEIVWQFDGTVEPRNEKFDFSPFFKNRGLFGSLENTAGFSLWAGGFLGNFDIQFTGSVPLSGTGTIKCH